MTQRIAWWYGLILVTAAAILGANIYGAIGAPSFEQVKRAMNLYPGRSTQINVNGEIVTVTLLSIHPIAGGRYAIVVQAK